MLILEENDWAEEKITSTKYKILKDANFSTNPEYYDRLENSLHKWKRVSITYNGNFYDGKGGYGTKNFGIINNWEIERNSGCLKIEFNKVWLDIIKNSNFFEMIDYNVMQKLKNPTQTRLYELLVKSFYNRNEWEIDAHKLAEKIPLHEKYVAHIIRIIKTAVENIAKKTDLKIKLEIKKKQRNEAVFKFIKTNKKTLPDEQGIPDEIKNLYNLIPEKNRTKKLPKTLEKLVANFTEEFIKERILYVNQKKKGNGSYKVYLEKCSTEEEFQKFIVRQEEDIKKEENIKKELSEKEKEIIQEKKIKLFLQEIPDKIIEKKIKNFLDNASGVKKTYERILKKNNEQAFKFAKEQIVMEIFVKPDAEQIIEEFSSWDTKILDTFVKKTGDIEAEKALRKKQKNFFE
jgi:hypothetical protein